MLLPSRSFELLSRSTSALVVIDMQEKLLPLVPHAALLTWNVARLVRGATSLAIPTAATEQYPEKLGSTVATLRAELPPAYAKRCFSVRECGPLWETWSHRGTRQLVVCGIETHVCVLQSVYDALAEGYRVSVVVDAVGARNAHDHEFALRRLEAQGASLTTTEAVLFEWCETSTDPAFKVISELIRQSPPV
jgi:nicotinamidase-related amidase